MGLSNQQIMNTFVLMAAGYQYSLVNQWMEGIPDRGLECQKPGIMNPASTVAARPGRPSRRFCRRQTKMNNVDPQAWLTQTLERLANAWPSTKIEALMPWNYAA
ncbi:hypothetical protein AS026_35780 [Rhizobium altiplani]|uniref:Transposase IS66 C-terminal domain-containing protein n=1 Tax=Rhizobium altiplani TaxID=1864509 RepID=A0A109JVS7_9HYPH|nr:hypothetical protein AS026_35780 [Rhizobium altiplani]